MKKGGVCIFTILIGFFVGAFAMFKICEKALIKEGDRAKRCNVNFRLSSKYLNMKQSNVSVADYLKKLDVKQVAIYGVGYLGKNLYLDLVEAGINVSYVIDRNKDNWDQQCKIYFPEDKVPEIEMIIVTPVYDFDEIKNFLDTKINTQVISLEKIFDELYE